MYFYIFTCISVYSISVVRYVKYLPKSITIIPVLEKAKVSLRAVEDMEFITARFCQANLFSNNTFKLVVMKQKMLFKKIYENIKLLLYIRSNSKGCKNKKKLTKFPRYHCRKV